VTNMLGGYQATLDFRVSSSGRDGRGLLDHQATFFKCTANTPLAGEEGVEERCIGAASSGGKNREQTENVVAVADRSIKSRARNQIEQQKGGRYRVADADWYIKRRRAMGNF